MAMAPTIITMHNKMLAEAPVDAVLLEYKSEGLDAEAVAYLIKQRFSTLPVILLSAYSDMPERILWLVDEHVLKSELPEGLVRVIERFRPAPCPGQHGKCHVAAA